ncbi:CaiB/BaiF CoA transferase family protein [Polynucleobacter rarus]|uniref:CaiB/BaiF CoA transferase family protein n=1 Tax=Polynucleobacter rarus TaxID=556055 RepID=UPI000D3E557D|nr:CoA transferase [Polynucleobacter rarus]
MTALSKFKVLDLTRARAGPTCVKQFADFGADVIKIEMSEGMGDASQFSGARHGPDMQNLHRNKKSLTLDLKQKEGLDIFYQLVKTADIVVENFRPDVKNRLGIDYETLKALNPRIILVSISGFGQDGPYVKRPMFDQISQGMSGIMSVTGDPKGGPMRAGVAITDITAGYIAACGAMTALLEREVSGQGQWVQSSLIQAGIAMMDFQAARYLMAGEIPQQVGNDHPTSMPTSCYQSSDGYINVAATGEPMWVALCTAMGIAELATDPRFTSESMRVAHRDELNQILIPILKSKPKAYWVELLNKAGVPTGPIYDMSEVFSDPQVISQDAAVEVEHPKVGKIRIVNQAVKLSRTPAKITHSAPELGEHSEEILRELCYSENQIQEFKTKKII